MNQQSIIGFGTDANVLAAYVNTANDRLGKIDLIIENNGDNQAYIQFREHDGTTSPSGWTNLGVAFTVEPRGEVSKTLNILSKRIGFFGSGNTTVNISTVIRNKGDLRGAQIDIVTTGRKGWGYDDGFDKNGNLRNNWGPPPDFPSDPEV